MKYSKKDAKIAKQIFEASLKEDTIDEVKIKSMVHKIKSLKLRNTKSIFLALVKELISFYKKQTLVVESTQNLPSDQLAEIKKYFEGKSGKTLNLKFKQDSSLIAGVRVILDDNVWDYSVNNTLENFKEAAHG